MQVGHTCIQLLLKKKKNGGRIHKIPQNLPTLKGLTNFREHFQGQENDVKQGSREHTP